MPPFKSVEKQVPNLQGEKLDLPKLRASIDGIKAVDPCPRVIIKTKYLTDYIDSTQGKGGH